MTTIFGIAYKAYNIGVSKGSKKLGHQGLLMLKKTISSIKQLNYIRYRL